MRQDRTKEYIRRVTARNARLRKGALVLEGVRLLGADGSPARGAAGSDTCEVFLHPGSPPLAGGATARLGAQHNDDASAGPIELVFTIYDQSPSSSSDAAASPSTSNEPSTLLSVAGQQQQRRQGSFTSSVPPSASSLARQRLLNHSSGGSSSSAAATGHATAMATAPLPLPPSPEKVTLPPAAPAAIAPSSASTPAEAPLQPVPRVVRVSRSHPTPVDVPAAASSSNGSPPPAGRQAPRVLSMDKRQLELLAGRIHAVGLKLPALCTCAAADPFDPNYVAKCCHNCPLYNQPEAYEQLLGHMLLHYGLL